MPSGTRIENRARIVFDFNDPIDTPLVFNTLDAGTPSSQLDPLPAETTSPLVTVTWTGQDDPGGSGIASYDLYGAVDGGPFALWISGLTGTTTDLNLPAGHTYALYTIARDGVGHVEPAPATPDATITVLAVLAVDAGPDLGAAEGQAVNVSGTFTYPGDPADLTLTIDWGDGTMAPGTIVPGEGGGTVSGSHTYADNGSYTVTLSLGDGVGPAVVDQVLVTVTNVAPVIVAIPDRQAAEGQMVMVNPTVTDPGTADTLSYRWTISADNGWVFLDQVGSTFSFVPPDNGTYLVTLTSR